MDQGRRNRRRKGPSYSNNICRNIPHDFIQNRPSKSMSFFNSLYSFFIMSCFIALFYLMLEHHCSHNCNSKIGGIHNITKNIEDISKNLSMIVIGYCDLEAKISKFSQELPKLEGQIGILEALANTIERRHLSNWNPKTQITQPNFDITSGPKVKAETPNITVKPLIPTLETVGI